MKVVLQVVSRASASVGGKVVGTIGKGFLLLLGVVDSNTIQIADKMVDKICKLRIFHDEGGKTNLSLADVDGKLLVISQFMLYAGCKRGNRLGFIRAGKPDKAEQLYEHVTERRRVYTPEVEHGIFGANTRAELANGGPFALVLNSEELGFQQMVMTVKWPSNGSHKKRLEEIGLRK